MTSAAVPLREDGSSANDGTEDQRLRLRAEALRSTYVFSTAVCGFADLKPDFHAAMSQWIQRQQRPHPDKPGELTHCRFKLGMTARDHLKSSVWTVADVLRDVTADTNLRVLITNETEDNITKWLNTMQAVVLGNTYKWLFPDCVPEFDAKRKPRWNQSQLELRRTMNWPQATIEGIPVGGASTSNHYNRIQNDDLVGKRARLEPSTMAKAIDHGKLCWSLLVNPAKDRIYDVGTRWHPQDYIDWRLKTSKNLDVFKLPFWKPGRENVEPWWPERFPADVIEQMRADLGAELWSLQYDNEPLAHGATEFDASKLRAFRWASRTMPNGTEKTFIILERPQHEGGDRWVELDSLSVVQVTDAGLRPESGAARTANVVVGLVPGECGNPFEIVVLAAEAAKMNPRQVIHRSHDVYERFQPMTWGIEVFGAHETFFWWIASEYQTARIRRLQTDTTKSKEARIREFYPFVDQGRVYVHRTQGFELIKEFSGFPNGVTVDLLDALAYTPSIWAPPQPRPTPDEQLRAWKAEWADELRRKRSGTVDGRNPVTGY